MSTDDSPEATAAKRNPTVAKVIDAASYVIAQLGIWLVIGSLVSLVFGGGIERIGQAYFVGGVVLFAIGAIKTRPEHAVERRRREVAEKYGDEEDPEVRGWLPVKANVSLEDEALGSPTEQLVLTSLPQSWRLYNRDARFSIGIKLFASGIVLWTLSYLLESVILF